MQQRQNEITGRSGGGPLKPIAGVSVTVYLRNADGSNGALAALYSDNGVTGKSNPLTTDQLGSYSYYAADGRYNEVISGAGIDTRTISDVLLEDPADNPVFDAANVAITGGTINGVDVADIQPPSAVAITGGTIAGVPVGDIASGVVAAAAVAAPRRLAQWFANGTANKKVAWIGDSTTLQLFTGGAITTGGPSSVAVPARYAGECPGQTWYNFGRNGGTLADFNADPATANGLNAIIAAAPDLPIISYGINDVRQGATSSAQLAGMLETIVNALLTALPNCDIILRMPNSFTTNDVGSAGYVTTTGLFSGMTVAEAAQAASAILRDAYRSLIGRWPNVAVYDSQKNVFPETCVASTATGFMADQIHPNVTGYRFVIDQLVQDYFGAGAVERMDNGYGLGVVNTWRELLAREFHLGRALDAVTNVGYRLAPTVYPQIVLNGDYELIAAGIASGAVTGGVSTSLQFDQLYTSAPYLQPGTRGGGLQVDDVFIQITGGQAYACLLNNISGAKNTTALQTTGGFGASAPNALTTANAGEPVLIYRNKHANSANAKAIAVQSQYPTRAVYRVASSALNTIVLVHTNQGPRDTQWTPRAGDILSFADIADITLTSAMTFTANTDGSQITLTQTGTNFTTTSPLCQIAGTGADRAEANYAQPLRLDIDGTVNPSGTSDAGGGKTYKRIPATRARYKVCYAYLETADGANATVVEVRALRNGSFGLLGTITFAAGSTSGTMSWQYSSNLMAMQGEEVRFVCKTNGSITPAGLHIVLGV